MFQFFAIIVFGCISSSGWFFLQDKNLEVCVMNMDASACHFSTMVRIAMSMLLTKINYLYDFSGRNSGLYCLYWISNW